MVIGKSWQYQQLPIPRSQAGAWECNLKSNKFCTQVVVAIVKNV